MKKISLFCLLAVLMCSCGEHKTENQLSKDSTLSVKGTDSATKFAAGKKSAVAGNVEKSLNGIDSAKVKEMTDNFDSTIFEKVIPRSKISVWLSDTVIRKMVALLSKERNGQSSTTKNTPDGIRIYFISQTTDKSELSVAIVSTKNGGPDPNNKGFTLHSDYYTHDGGDSLYSSGINLAGERGFGSCGGGALLQSPCVSGCPDEDCIISTAPDHKITRKFGERMLTLFGNDVIRTKSVWFDFDMLKSLSTVANPFDGIRIYFGNYGKFDADGKEILSDTDRNGYEKKRDRDTFVLTITKPDATKKGVHIDRFDCESLKKAWTNLFGGTLNNGELCPSHCN